MEREAMGREGRGGRGRNGCIKSAALNNTYDMPDTQEFTVSKEF